MDVVSIAFATVIPINVLLFLHHMYYSYKHVANDTEKIYYYLTAIIPLAPAVMYSFQLITHLTHPTYPEIIETNVLDVFFVSWVVTNPLLIINLGKVVNIRLNHYFILVGCDLTMYIIGFLAYKTADPIIFISSIVISCVMFCIILGTIIYLYYYKKYPEGYHHMLPIYKILTKFIIMSWPLYPTMFILLKTGNITIIECAIAFIVLDFLTKSIFSSIIIVYHRNLNRRKSLADYLRRSSQRIMPLDSILELPEVNEQKE